MPSHMSENPPSSRNSSFLGRYVLGVATFLIHPPRLVLSVRPPQSSTPKDTGARAPAQLTHTHTNTTTPPPPPPNLQCNPNKSHPASQPARRKLDPLRLAPELPRACDRMHQQSPAYGGGRGRGSSGKRLVSADKQCTSQHGAAQRRTQRAQSTIPTVNPPLHGYTCILPNTS